MIERRKDHESSYVMAKRYRAAQSFIFILNQSRRSLTAQQYKTLKGQALSGDLEGAWRGLKKLQRQYD